MSDTPTRSGVVPTWDVRSVADLQAENERLTAKLAEERQVSAWLAFQIGKRCDSVRTPAMWTPDRWLTAARQAVKEADDAILDRS